MIATILSAVITTIGVIVVTVLTTRSNRKGAAATNALAEQQVELSERVVDREDFETIVRELRQSLTDVRAELAQVKQDLAAEVTARREAERRAVRAEQRATEAELRADEAGERATELERRVTQLEQENEKLRDDLLIATRLLEQKYPDEPDEAPDLA